MQALLTLDQTLPFTVSVGTPDDTWTSDLGEVSLTTVSSAAYTKDGSPCAVLRGWMSSEEEDEEG